MQQKLKHLLKNILTLAYAYDIVQNIKQKLHESERRENVRINREKFAAAIVRADLNGNQLAKKANVSRGTVTAVRTGKSCSRQTAEKLAAGLGVNISDIVSDNA